MSRSGSEDEDRQSALNKHRASYSSVRSRIEIREWRSEKNHYPVYSELVGHNYKRYKFCDHVHEDSARGDIARLYYQRARLGYTVRNGPAEDEDRRAAKARRDAAEAAKPASSSSSSSSRSSYKSKYSPPSSSRSESTRPSAVSSSEYERPSRYVPFSTTLSASKRLDEMRQEKRSRNTQLLSETAVATGSSSYTPSSYSSSPTSYSSVPRYSSSSNLSSSRSNSSSRLTSTVSEN